MAIEEQYLSAGQIAYWQSCKTALASDPSSSLYQRKLADCENDLQKTIDKKKATVANTTSSSTELDLIPFPFATGDSNVPVGILDNVKFRVFVMGVEISDYLQDVSWTHDATTEMIGSVGNVTLSVPRDLLTFTDKNLDEGQLVNWVISNDFRVNEKAKRDLYIYKADQNYYDKATLLARWNLAPNSLCIHHGDTIRIFAHIPWTRLDAWLPVFTGYVREPSLSRNTNGVDKITFGCYTLAEKLTKARVLSRFSAVIADPKTIGSAMADSQQYMYGQTGIDVLDINTVFQDSLSGTWNTPLLNTTLQGLIQYLFYGDLGKLNDGPASFAQLISSNASSDVMEESGRVLSGERSQRTLSLISAYQRSIEKLRKVEADPTSSQDNIANARNQVDSLKQQLKDIPGVLNDQGYVVMGGDKTAPGSAANDFRAKRGLGFLTDDLFFNFEFPISGKITYTATETTANEVVDEKTKAEVNAMKVCEKGWPLEIKDPWKHISSDFHNKESFRDHVHQGIDIATGPTKLIAPINGRILEVNLDANKDSGLYVRMLGEDGYAHIFMHLSKIETGLSFGKEVKKNQKLGTTGNTGKVTGTQGGYHLHWEVWKWTASIPDWTKTPPKSMSASGRIDPYKWVNSAKLRQNWIDNSSSADTTGTTGGTASVDSSSIDWEKEVDTFEAWKTCCLTGWGNNLTEEVAKSVADKIDGLTNLNPKDCFAGDRKRVYLTDDEVTAIGKNSGWLGPFSPHGQNISVVVRSPKAGWGINPGFVNGREEGLTLQSVSYQAGVQTKAQILVTLLERIDYYWHITGNGDVVFEFPAYEMLPDHFGEKYKKEYSLSDIIQNDTITEEFQNLKSTYVFIGSMGGLFSPGSAGDASNRFTQVSYKLPTVAARNGIEIEEKFWPFITEVDKLNMFGAIYLRKQIANSHKYTTSSLPPLLYIAPNTPVYLEDIDCYALARSITFTANIPSASFQSSIEFTAVRQRLTPEQLYLKANGANIRDGQKVTTVAVSSFKAGFDINTLKITNNSEAFNANIQNTLFKYGYIIGAGDLLIDYTKLCSQNILSASKFKVLEDKSLRKEVMGVAIFESSADRLTSTPEVDDSGIERPQGTHFSNPVELPTQVKASLNTAINATGLTPEVGKALAAHANVTTGIQPNWFEKLTGFAKDLGKAYEKGVGFLNLTGNVMSQVANTSAAFGAIVTSAQQTVNAGISANGNLSSAIRSMRLGLSSVFGSSVMSPEDAAMNTIKYDPNTKAKTITSPVVGLPQPNAANQNPLPYLALDPRSNTDYSALMGALIAKETINQISTIHGTKTSLQASEINPDILGMSLQFGPKDPAFKKTIKEVDPTDTSETASDSFARKLQQNLYLLGGYSKSDLNYCDFYRQIRKEANKRGMHSLE